MDDNARARTLARLVARAITKHQFLEPPPLLSASGDAVKQWMRNLVAHVEQRDWADAFEIMIGKDQADWSPEDVQAFADRRMKPDRPRAKREFGPNEFFAVPAIEERGRDHYECSPDSVMALAAKGLAWFVDERKRAPTRELPILASILLMDGHTLTAACDSENRIAVIKHLARTRPVYGFWLIFDAFVHAMELGPQAKATKRDCLICQLGTRDMRRMMRRTYEVLHGVAVFDPAVEDLDDDAVRSGEDPYAEIFVSVPTPSGKAS